MLSALYRTLRLVVAIVDLMAVLAAVERIELNNT
jgi:hypothetical protein